MAADTGYEADIAQKQATLEVNDAQIERARLTLPVLEEKHQVAQGLYDKRYGSRPLVAPVDGSVQGLKIHTPGAVVTTAGYAATRACLSC